MRVSLRPKPAEPPSPPGEMLRGMLASRGVTQDQLADAMSVSRLTINQIVNRKRDISYEMAARLGKALGTTPTYWLDLQREFDLFVHAGRMAQAANETRRL